MNKEIVNQREVQQEQIKLALKVLQLNSPPEEPPEDLSSVLDLFKNDPWYLNIFSIWFRKSPEDILKIFTNSNEPTKE